MRAVLAALAAAGSMLVLAGCSDVRSSAEEAASSAASIGAGVRSSAASVSSGLKATCQASDSSLTTLDDLAGKLADNADLRDQLSPQIKATVDRLAASVGNRAELKPVVAAGRDLITALGDGNETAVELSARQTQVAVRSAEALCKLTK